ncbi:MAG: thermonuclease family protein [Solirubrobacterales bacterium]|nr:thermonuclease family protein [Solirubrobacterales bacterium]
MRRLIRRIVVIIACSFSVGYLSTGNVTQVVSAFGQITGALGINELVESFDQIGHGDSAGAASTPRSATVTRAVDGDTLEVTFKNGATADVRLIGYDTPESKRPGVAVECGGLEAAAFTKKVTEGKPVKLTVDPSQDKIDRYGRLLRYARIDGNDVGRRVIAAGWGAPYVYDESSPPKFTDAYRKTATAAERSGKGAWGLCAGNFHSEDDEPWSGD